MRRLIALSAFYLSVMVSSAQTETTFKTNGPDDFREGIHAFTNATIWKNYNTKLDSATLIIREGKIEAVGRGIALPQGAIVHDMKGRYIYPSFIDIYSDYGMPEMKKAQWDDKPHLESDIKGAYGWNQAIHTDFIAVKNFTANASGGVEDLRKLGFGAVLTHKKDGIARGTGVVVSLGNDKENNLIIKSNASAHYSFNKGSSTQDYPSSLMGSIALLRQTYYDAEWYRTTKEKKEYNINLEEWNTQQALPQVFEAGDWQKIVRADKIGDEFGVQYIIKASGDAYQRIDEVKATNAKLITTLNFPKPFDVEDPYKAQWVSLEEMKHWELAPTNCAALAKAGIDFALTTADLEKKEDFLNALRKAVKHGLDSSAALKALTFSPANFLNVYDQVGSLEAGKLANFFITSKPLFDDKCEINENWIGGRRYDVKPFDQKDIRGTYQISWCPSGAKCKQIPKELKVTGDINAPKATITMLDSVKIDVKLSYKENDISLVFNSDKKGVQNKIRLTGFIDHTTKLWSGKGQYADGQWIDWKAVYMSAAEADTTKAKKDSTDYTKALGKVLYPFTAYGSETLPKQENVLLKNGTVWTNESEGILSGADVVIKGGKIAGVGKGLACADCKVIDATGKHVTSGIIDEHNHIAISQGVNEGTKASSAEVRIGDVVSSEDVNIYRQLAGGVTAAQLLHGSANPIGGQSAMIKFRWGYAPEKMKVEGADGFIKFALGENVKQSNWGDRQRVRYPQTRMGVEQTYYNYFTKAREYEAKWKGYNSASSAKGKNTIATSKPRRDLELDALVEIMNQKRFITCHSYVQSEINMLIHVADSFKFKVNTFTHILEGYKVADKMKAHGAYGSTFADWWAYKYEVLDAIPYNASIMTKMGITTAINSDDAEMARRLNQEAAKSVKYGGLTEEQAWKMVTYNPAKMLHLDKQMGSLKAGKDADVVVWSANPLSIYAVCEQTYVDGICFFDYERDAQMRDWVRSERARLIQKMLDDKKGGAPTQEPIKKENKAYSCGEHDEH